jgi:rhodanese-related sulfurtransferase
MRGRLLGAVLGVTLAAGCVLWPEGSGPSAAPMPLDQALALRDREEAVIIDVRSPRAFTAGHIPGALNMPGSTIASQVPQLRRLAKLPILYCG